MVETRPIAAKDYEAVLNLVAGLPEWFDEDARTRSIPTDLKHQDGFVAESDGRVVGFITLFVAGARLNIGWLGVCKDWHRQGVGSQLIARAEQAAAAMGLHELATYTLGDAVDYSPYELTRAFYAKQGFVVYQRSKTDNPGCPEEIRLSKEVAQPGVGD